MSIKFDTVLGQFNQCILIQRETFVIMGNNHYFTDCVKKKTYNWGVSGHLWTTYYSLYDS